MEMAAMIEHETLHQIALDAKSPFELRVNLSRDVPERDLQAEVVSGNAGFLHSFTTGSTVDGPGVRLVAWTAGCMFQCLYCHNPDTWTMRNGMLVPIERAVEELRKYRFGLKIMSGGFTLSGGEPLLQHHFAVKLFAAAKQMGIHTALDTNGYLGCRLSDHELEQIDLVLLDLKGWDAERHQRLTGMDNAPILEFARRLAARKRPVWVRFVLVPGLTDDPKDIREDRRLRSHAGECRTRGCAPVSSNGPIQMDATRHGLQTAECRAAIAGGRGTGVRPVPRGWTDRLLS